MKRFLTGMFGILIFSSVAAAQVPLIDLGFGVRAGARTPNKGETGEFGFGGQVYLGISKLTFVPNYEFTSGTQKIGVLKTDVKWHTINLDLQYELYGLAVAKMYAGGGYVIQAAKPKGSSYVSETSNGFNLQIGGKAGVGPLNVFGLAKANFIKVKSIVPGEDSKSRTNYQLVVGANFNLL